MPVAATVEKHQILVFSSFKASIIPAYTRICSYAMLYIHTWLMNT